MIAAEVLSVNARSGESDHKYICTGSTVDGSVIPWGTSAIKATFHHVVPAAIPIMVPVSMPGMAAGTT